MKRSPSNHHEITDSLRQPLLGVQEEAEEESEIEEKREIKFSSTGVHSSPTLITTNNIQIETHAAGSITITHSPKPRNQTQSPTLPAMPPLSLMHSNSLTSSPNSGRLFDQSNSRISTVIDLTSIEEEIENVPQTYLDIGWDVSAFLFISLLSLVSAGANAINAGTNVTDSQPRDISEEWWNAMTLSIQLYTLWNLVASLVVNYIFGNRSIPETREKMRKFLFKRHQTTSEKIENLITITLGSSAAIASAAISYNAFTWASLYLANAVSISSFFINFTTRYAGVKNLINRARAHYDADMLLKKQFTQDLKRIDSRYIGMINDLINESFVENRKKLDDQTIVLFAGKLSEKLDTIPGIITEATGTETVMQHTVLAMEILFALSIGLAAFPTFTQKGFDGFNKLCHDVMSDLDSVPKGLIGTLPGLATAMLYAISAFDLPQLTVDIIKQMLNHGTSLQMGTFGLFCVMNGFASGSMANVAEGILESDKPIFGFLNSNKFLSSTYVTLNRMGGGVTNTKATITLPMFQPELKSGPMVADVIYYLNSRTLDDKLSRQATRALKNLSHFSHPSKTTDSAEDGDFFRLLGEAPGKRAPARRSLPVPLPSAARDRAIDDTNHLRPPRF